MLNHNSSSMGLPISVNSLNVSPPISLRTHNRRRRTSDPITMLTQHSQQSSEDSGINIGNDDNSIDGVMVTDVGQMDSEGTLKRIRRDAMYDDENMRRQQRLEKNREAAHLFRQRQKQYLLDLERKVELLNTENAEYKAKMELLRTENQMIKEQLGYLRNFISQALTFFPASQGSPAMVTGLSLSDGSLLKGTSIVDNNESGVDASGNSGNNGT